MTQPSRLINVFQNSLEGIEKEEKLKSDDPALIELKSSVARTIAELEVRRDSRKSESLGTLAKILEFPGALKGAIIVKKRQP
ncbi:MAG: hypothetical protein ACRD3N_09510 [Terracidiphilus sp.]